jgi:hypothetical protein
MVHLFCHFVLVEVFTACLTSDMVMTLYCSFRDIDSLAASFASWSVTLTPPCDCGEEETTEHYILHCHVYDHEWAKLAVQLKTIDKSFDLLHLLTRDSNKEKHYNKLTFLEEYINSTGRFPELASLIPRS